MLRHSVVAQPDTILPLSPYSCRSAGASAAAAEIALGPLEFKSGKGHYSHGAQVAVYFLLMEARYKVKVDKGLLWYAKEGPWQLVDRTGPNVAGALRHARPVTLWRC